MSGVFRVGRHRFLSAPVSRSSAELLLGGEQASLVYSDPPWGPGALHLFDTMNRTVRQVWINFCSDFAEAVAAAASGPVCLLVGQKALPDVEAALAREGIVRCFSEQAEYGSPVYWPSLGRKKRMEAVLWGGHVQGGGWSMPVRRLELHGPAIVRRAIEATCHADGLVYDPCVGLGLVARAAERSGRRFCGGDMNSERLRAAMDSVSKEDGRERSTG